ncbi:MAG: lysophospholipid acyltransferase family protein [Maritimibacter sp.]|nr:lysophospholipid acyltransferase family protein [Maritimibacter sp.]
MTTARIARDLSYASGLPGLRGRLVRTVEALTGRPALVRRARGYDVELASGGDFWEVMAQRYGLSLDLVGRGLADIPREGPLVVVANHPFGILDGLMMGHILARARGGDFRILAHQVFGRAPELERVILPIDFSETPCATRDNVATRRAALDYLSAGGAVGIFPGGTVSTPAHPFGQPMDPAWRLFTARMVLRSRATVVPVFFEGANSRLFHIASHMSYALRMGLLLKEFRARTDRPVRATIGAAINPERLAAYAADPRALMAYLRQRTYGLSPEPLDWRACGHEFEAHHR